MSSSDPPRTAVFDKDGVDIEQTLDDDERVCYCIASGHAPAPSYGELRVGLLATNHSLAERKLYTCFYLYPVFSSADLRCYDGNIVI